MTKPRILMVLTEFPPRIGGMQTHAINLVRHLCARGYRLEVVTYQAGDGRERAARDGVDKELPCPVHRVMSRLGYFHNFNVLEGIGRRFNPQLVYTSTVFYGQLGERLGVPVIARSVGNDVMRPWIAYPFRFGSRWAGHPAIEDRLYRFFRRLETPEIVEVLFRGRRRKLMAQSARLYQRIFANSQYTQGLLQGVGVASERLDLLVGGVDNARFRAIVHDPTLRARWGIPEERTLLVTVCRLVRKKGVDFLIDAMPTLLRRFPTLHLLVVGSGRQRKRLRRQAARSTAAERITFAGRVEHDEIENAYAAADAFVLASRVHVDPSTGLRDAETMGRVLCEANAAGLPVVAARSGGIPSVVTHGENGLLFEPDDVESLSTQLRRLNEEPGLAASLIRRGRELASTKFDWSVVVEAHEERFAECLRRGA